MRIWLLSDLHREVSPWEPPADPPEHDLVVLAGDIGRGVTGIEWAQQAFEKTVVYVAGNHEHYRTGTVRENLVAMQSVARGSHVHFLENESVVIDGARFLGCTLWTDFKVEARLSLGTAMEIGANSLNDFSLCRWIDFRGRNRKFYPRDSLMLHKHSRQFLERELATRWQGATVVVTHHLPSPACIHSDYVGSELNPCFASDLDHLVQQANAWLHGHTHAAVHAQVGPCRVHCNPRGYRDTPEHDDAPFDSHFTFEV